MSWETSLVRIADFEVEELRKRLSAVLERKAMAELSLVMLHAEAESESARGIDDAEAGWYRIGWLQGWRLRRDRAQAEIARVEQEEAGARDALNAAFEDLKKYEQVADNAKAAKVKKAARLETAMFDELGLRQALAS